MSIIALPVDLTSKNQAMTLDMDLNGERKPLRVELVWREYIAKYMINILDAATGEALVTNVPVVASSGDVANDLLRQFAYKGIGTMYCAPIVTSPTHEDPTFETMNEYELDWGGSVWTDTEI